MNGHRFVIVGVMPHEFNGISVDTAPDLRIPLKAFPWIANYKIESAIFALAARLKPGIALRLARQMVTESVLLAVLGTAAGLLISFVAIQIAVHLLPPLRDLMTSVVPLSINAGLNRRVLVFVIGMSAVITLIFSVSPVLCALRMSINGVLRASRSSSGLQGLQVLIVLQNGAVHLPFGERRPIGAQSAALTRLPGFKLTLWQPLPAALKATRANQAS